MSQDPPGLDFSALPEVPERPPRRWFAGAFGLLWTLVSPSWERWIAVGHLRSKKSEAFISLTTILSVVGVVAGVAVLNWVLAVMTGFEVDLRDKILGANAHVVVLSYDGSVPESAHIPELVRAVDGVEAAAPFVYTELMIRSTWGKSGIILKGIDPGSTGDVTNLRDSITHGLFGEVETDAERAGVFASLAEPIPSVDPGEPALPGILIGSELREVLQVTPGDTVQIINPLGDGTTILGLPAPAVRVFRVAGVYHSGMYEYDTKWTYVSIDDAQSFLRLGDEYTGVEIKATDVDDVHHLARDLELALGPAYYTRHWKELNQALFEALEMEKFVMGLILSTIVGVAALAIVTTLVMLVLTKRREIAILKAMGASTGSIMNIFVIEGWLIGLVGTVLGTVLGLVGCDVIDRYQYPLDTDVYYLSSLPVVVDPWVVVVVAVGAFAISFLATLYPAWQAASLDPVEGLRYE